MFKRVLCVMAAVMVASSSAMAWTAESFVGNDYDQQETYTFEPVSDVPMRLMSSRSSSSDSLYEVDVFYPSSIDRRAGDHDFILWGSVIYNFNEYLPYDWIGAELNNLSVSNDGVGSYFLGNVRNTSFNYDAPTGNVSEFLGWKKSYFGEIIFTYDIPVPTDTYGVSFSPDLWCYGAMGNGTGPTEYTPFSVRYYIDDVLFEEYSSDSYLSHVTVESTFTSTRAINSLRVEIVFPPTEITSGLPTSLSGTTTFRRFMIIREGSYLNIGFLDKFGSLNVHNDQAQSIINDHNAIESEWTGSMTSNFNALSIETFSFPSGLVSAFGLITGIFNDLWNGMGEYKIAYVFPLTLGVALLLIGRISKFAGGQSSGKRNRGDDGA